MGTVTTSSALGVLTVDTSRKYTSPASNCREAGPAASLK